jgi:two-component system, sensor histidine kinase and response regulator
MLKMLAAAGALPSAAAGASEALEVLRAAAAHHPYQVALLDLNMPEVDGIALARAIKSDPLLAPTHLLLLTSSGQRGSTQDAIEAGIAGYLTKPIRFAQLHQQLRAYRHPNHTSPATTRPATGASAEALPGQPPEPAAGTGLRLLLAEDNPINQKVAQGILKRLGHTVHVVGDGRAALDALAGARTDAPFDAVLMDCQMPVMDGYTATRNIRRDESESGRRRIPIIALTASAMAEDRQRCMSAGMDDYVSKPLDPQQLASTLDRWTTTSDAPDANARDIPRQATPDQVTDSGEPAVSDEVFRTLMQRMADGQPDSELRQELIDDYIALVPAKVDELLTRLREHNPDAVTTLAHHLCASCETFGALQFARLLRQAEDTARTHPDEPDAFDSLVDPLQREHRRVIAELTARRV